MDLVSITSLGAVGNDSDASSVANSDAFDAAFASSPEGVFVPTGVYRLARQLLISPTTAQHGKPFYLCGQDQYRSILKPASTYTTVEPLVNIDVLYPTRTWAAPMIECLGVIGSNGLGVRSNAQRLTMRQMQVGSCKKGGILLTTGSMCSVLEDLFLASNGTTAGTRDYVGLELSGGNNARTLISNVVSCYHDKGIFLNASYCCQMNHCDISGNNIGIDILDGRANRVIDVYGELLYPNSKGVKVRGMMHQIIGAYLDNKSTGVRPIDIDGGYHQLMVKQVQIYGNQSSYTGDATVYMGA
jgi:hypothetical protein